MATKYSVSAAHRITGKSRTTITKHLNSGKLSWEDDGQGNKLIDASELMRLYGDDCDFSKEEEGAATPAAGVIEQGVQGTLNTLQAQLAKEVAERERERAHYRQQVEQLQDALKLAQEGHNKAMLLLEHRTGGGEWQKAVDLLEARIANHEVAAKGDLKTALANTREEVRREFLNQPWWKVVFSAKPA